MQVLIVESNAELGALWKRHIERFGHQVQAVRSQQEAIAALSGEDIGVVVLNLFLDGGSAVAVADYASYRRPDTKVIFVTNTAFFSDGSIFQHIGNAAAMVPSDGPPDDLAALVDYHGGVRSPPPAAP